MIKISKEDFLRDSNEEDYKKFEDWYNSQENRFHLGQLDEKQIAYASWCASKRDLIDFITQD